MIAGKEKAWSALLAGGTVTAATTFAIWLMSLTGAIEAPGPDAIHAAVTGIVASVFAAMGAYVATNTVPADKPMPAPIEAVPPTPVIETEN